MGHSVDFRQRVLACKKENDFTFEKTSEHFNVSLRTLFRWGNNIAPCTHRQKPATKLDMDALKKEIESSPDDYQWERAKRLGVSQTTLHYALKRINISFKKTLKHPKADENARADFQCRIEGYKKRAIKKREETLFISMKFAQRNSILRPTLKCSLVFSNVKLFLSL